MLQEQELKTASAGRYAYAAAIDAERTSQRNASCYTSSQRAAANTARDLLDMAYAYKGLHINYRKTFIAIKVDAPIAKDKLTVKSVKEVFNEKGYTVVVTPQGIVVRISKAK